MAINMVEAYEKLNRDLEQFAINNSIRYDFIHNVYHCRIFYTREHNLYNALTLIVEINQVFYPFVMPEINSESVSEYVVPEIYQHIKPLFINDDYKTHAFFEHVRNTILNNDPIGSIYNLQGPGIHHLNNNDYLPYFECFSRMNMSENMRTRISQAYSSELSNRIITFCNINNLTTRFTSNIERAKDIIFEMENYQ